MNDWENIAATVLSCLFLFYFVYGLDMSLGCFSYSELLDLLDLLLELLDEEEDEEWDGFDLARQLLPLTLLIAVFGRQFLMIMNLLQEYFLFKRLPLFS